MANHENDPRSRLTQGNTDSYTGSMSGETGEAQDNQGGQSSPKRRARMMLRRPDGVQVPLPDRNSAESQEALERRLQGYRVALDAAPHQTVQAQQVDTAEPQRVRETRRRQEGNEKAEWNIASNIKESVEIAKDETLPDYKKLWHAQALQRWSRVLLESPQLKLKEATEAALKKFTDIDFTTDPSSIPEALAAIEQVNLSRFYERLEQQYPDDAQCIEHLLFLLAKHDRGKTSRVREYVDQFMPGEKYSLLNPDGTPNRQNYQFFMRGQHVYWDDDGTYKPYNMFESFGYEFVTRAGGKVSRPMQRIYNDPDYFQQRVVVFTGDENAGAIQGVEMFEGQDAGFRTFQNSELFTIDVTVDRLQSAHRQILYAGTSPDALYNQNLMVQGEISRWSNLINLSSYEHPGDAVLGDAFKGGWNAHKFLLELFSPKNKEEPINRVKDSRGVEVSMLRKVLNLKGFSEMCKAIGNEILIKTPDENIRYAASVKEVLEDRRDQASQQGNTAAIEIYDDVIDKLDEASAKNMVAINLFDNPFLTEAITRVQATTGVALSPEEITAQVRGILQDKYVPGLIRQCEEERAKVMDTTKANNYTNAIDALKNLLPLVGLKRDLRSEAAQIQTDRARLEELRNTYYTLEDGSDEQQRVGREWNALNRVREIREARYQNGEVQALQRKREELLQRKGMKTAQIGEEWGNSYIDELFAQQVIGIAGYSPDEMLPFNAPTRDLVVQRLVHRALMAGVWGGIDQEINPIDKQYVSNLVWNVLPYTIWTSGDYQAIAQGGTEYTRQKRLRMASGRAGAGPLILVNGIKKANPGYGRVIRHSRVGEANFDVTTEELLQGGTGIDWNPSKYRGNWYTETDAEKGYGNVYKNSTELPEKRAERGLLRVDDLVKEEPLQTGKLLVTNSAKEHSVQGQVGAAKSLWETYLKRSKLDKPKYYFGSEYNPYTHKYELGWYFGTSLTEMFEPTILALDSLMNADKLHDPDRSLARPAFAYEVAMETIGHFYEPSHYGSWGTLENAKEKIDPENTSSFSKPRTKAFVGLSRLSIDTKQHEIAPGITIDEIVPYFTSEQLHTLLTPDKYFALVKDYIEKNPVTNTPNRFEL